MAAKRLTLCVLYIYVCFIGCLAGDVTLSGNPVNKDQQTQNGDVASRFENGVSDTCKKVVKSMSDSSVQRTRQQACLVLINNKSALFRDGCSQADFKTLDEILCGNLSAVPTTTLTTITTTPQTSRAEPAAGKSRQKSPLNLEWEKGIENVIYKELSPFCKTIILAIPDRNPEPIAACQRLESSKMFMMTVCSQKDFDKMRDAVCGFWEKRTTVTTASTSSTSSYLDTHTITATTSSTATSTTRKSVTTTSGEDFHENHQAHNDDDGNDEDNGDDEEIKTDEQRRSSALSVIENDLTKKCQDLVWPQAQRFLDSFEEGCRLLKTARTSLVDSEVCTQRDYELLEDIVCSSQKVDPKEVEEQEHLVDVVGHLSPSCRTSLQAGAEAGSGRSVRDSACSWMPKSVERLMRENICLKQDYEKVKEDLCGSGMADRASKWLVLVLLCVVGRIVRVWG